MFRIKSFLPLAIRILFLLLLTACMTIPQLGYAAPSLQTGATTAGAKAGQTTGQLSFAYNKDVPAGSFTLALAGVPAPPAGSHYELWLQGDDGTYLDLGKAPVTNGQIKFSGATKQSLLVAHKVALLSLEPDQDPSPAISTQILLTSTLSTPMLTALRPLFIGTQGADLGFLGGANFEIRVIIRHIGYLGDALDRLDMDGQNGIKLHAEHIINTIDGPSGLLYSDWDKDGQISDPGDKVGLRVYLEQLKKQSAILADALKASAAPKELQDQAQQIKTSAEAGQALIKDIIDVTRKIFADDDAEGAQPHVAEVLNAREPLQKIGTAVTDATFQIATFRFAGTIALPKTAPVATKPGAVATATLVPFAKTPTKEITTTLTAIPTQTVAPASTSPSTLTVAPPAEAQPGATWQNPVDGGEYVFVPGGESTMGASGGDGVTAQEKPEHKVKVGDFWLQRTEVTNAQYDKCVKAGVCTAPTDDEWEEEEYKNFPVAHVDWVQANTYARWAGGRLPTEAEWEHACRGEDARIYPWGNNPPTDKLANFNNNIGESTDVGSFPDGASPFGILDMSGNVWEWTSSLEKPYPYVATDGREDAKADGKRVVRGGSFYYTQYQLRCSTRSGYLPNTQNQHFGFRVAFSVASNSVWRNPVDDGEYVFVPGGESTMGASGGDGVTAQEKPEHKVKVGDFWLQRTEVTNAQYGKCVDDGVCTAPTDDEWEEEEYKNFPVAHVDWVQANTYARWAGGRLPTEAEWEHACRGEDARIYPWGNNPPTDKLANFNNNIGESTDVGSFPDGASPFGLLDMSGNVWEWTSSLEKPYPYVATDGREDAKADGKRVVRGGSFYYTQYQLRCSTRSGYLPNTQNQHFGFRVALDKPAK